MQPYSLQNKTIHTPKKLEYPQSNWHQICFSPENFEAEHQVIGYSAIMQSS